MAHTYTIATNQEKVEELFKQGSYLCVREAQRYYPEFDLMKAANGITHSNDFKDHFFRIYSSLMSKNAIVEAYCLLKMAFGQLTTADLMELYEEAKLLTEEMAYQAAEHDAEAPF